MSNIYRETFDNGPGGWYGWIDNFKGPKALERASSAVVSRSPWWVDYNHAPPGAGYLHMIFCLMTQGPGFGEALMETGGRNRFVEGGVSTDFRNARFSVRLRGELLARDAGLVLLVQGTRNGLTAGWALTGQPLTVSPDWTDQTMTLSPDPAQWTCLGSRHDRTKTYGHLELLDVLSNVNTNILLIMFPLDIAPMGPVEGDPHRLRADRDYPLWRSRLPEGYIVLDEVRIEFPSVSAGNR